MKQENFNIVDDSKGKSLPANETGPRKPRILVAPLDWGLGHATRCIPLIYELLRQDCEVWMAGEGAQEALLKQEFPNLSFLPLPGYRVHYGRSLVSTILRLFAQSGKIVNAIRYENRWLKKVVHEHLFDGIISDNRFGLFHRELPSIFITHQLRIKSSLGKASESWLQKRNYRYINKFSECWIPDMEGANNLAGELSHPSKKPAVTLRYLGPLSRLSKTDQPEASHHLLVIISGPEPQRSLFEDKIIRDIAHFEGTAVVIRGLPGSATVIPSTNDIRFYNHLPAAELNKEMNRAEYIIGRSGYSTIMDIVKLQKKSILIATPGQTEQEYLAKYMMKKNWAISISQDRFSLFPALELAASFPYKLPASMDSDLHKLLSEFVRSLQRK